MGVIITLGVRAFNPFIIKIEIGGVWMFGQMIMGVKIGSKICIGKINIGRTVSKK